jgi:hypothetical protein
MSYTYNSLDSARSAIRVVGDTIAKDGLPSEIGPMTFTFTGSGNVSKVGARKETLQVKIQVNSNVRLNVRHPQYP